MIAGKVVGSVVATRKNERLLGSKFMIVEPMEKISESNTKIIAVDDEFIEHGTVKELFKIIGLDSASIEKTVRREIELGKA